MPQQRVKIQDLSKAVEQTLDQYAGVVYSDMAEAIDDTSAAALSEIRSNAQGYGWKDYAKTWTKKAQKSNKATAHTVVLHAKSGGYQIAHLLEKGHAKRGGGRTRAYPHIAPAEAHAEERLVTLLRQKIGG